MATNDVQRMIGLLDEVIASNEKYCQLLMMGKELCASAALADAIDDLKVRRQALSEGNDEKPQLFDPDRVHTGCAQ